MNADIAIEQALAKAEQGTLDSEMFFSTLATEMPEVFTFLFDEDTRLLQEQEHDYLLFISMVLIDTLRQTDNQFSETDIELLHDLVEDNWGLLEHTSIDNISETLSRHPAYPMYEFLEDACTPDDEEQEILSDVAAELIYVKCKSLVDSAYLSLKF